MVMSCSMVGEKCSDNSRAMGWDEPGVAPAPLSSSTGTTTGLWLTITTVVLGRRVPVASIMGATL